MIPGAPPVKLASVAVIRTAPFCRNETVDPTAVTFSCVPAASGPLLYVLPTCVQLWPPLRSTTSTPGLTFCPEQIPAYAFAPPPWPRPIAPLRCPPLSCAEVPSPCEDCSRV